MSTKGQVVIPEGARKDIEVGTVFSVTRKEDLIVLKKVSGLTEEEKEEIKELSNIWKEVEEGKGITKSKEDFLKEMNAW